MVRQGYFRLNSSRIFSNSLYLTALPATSPFLSKSYFPIQPQADSKSLSKMIYYFYNPKYLNNRYKYLLMAAVFSAASIIQAPDLNDPVEYLITDHLREIKKNGLLSILQAPLTETAADETAGLSNLAKHDLPQAIRIFENFSRSALAKHPLFSQELKLLKKDCENTLRTGHQVITLGCGSAGRSNVMAFNELSRMYPQYASQLKLGIAGGSAALIRAIEHFEDSSKYGVKQLENLNVKSGDTVILMSASGSATFLKGIIQHIIALNKKSDKKIKCYFIINNPVDPNLKKTIFQNIPVGDYDEDIHILSFPAIAPQAIAGSTRLQAANFQFLTLSVMLADAIESINQNQDIFRWNAFCEEHLSLHEKIRFENLSPLIDALAKIYLTGKTINITVDPRLAAVVTSDTTELAPTFRTTPISHPSDRPAKSDDEKVAPYQITIRGCKDSAEAWEALLGKKLVALNFNNVPQTQLPFILQYNLGPKNYDDNHVEYNISLSNGYLHFELDKTHIEIPLGQLPSSLKSLQEISQIQLVKDILNLVSTLAMGRIDRYFSNLMIYVKPSNRKLVTRGIRLSYTLLMQVKQLNRYEDLYPIMKQISSDVKLQEKLLTHISLVFYDNMLKSGGKTDSIVLETTEQIANQIRSFPSPAQYIQYLQSIKLPAPEDQLTLSAAGIFSKSAAISSKSRPQGPNNSCHIGHTFY